MPSYHIHQRSQPAGAQEKNKRSKRSSSNSMAFEKCRVSIYLFLLIKRWLINKLGSKTSIHHFFWLKNFISSQEISFFGCPHTSIENNSFYNFSHNFTSLPSCYFLVRRPTLYAYQAWRLQPIPCNLHIAFLVGSHSHQSSHRGVGLGVEGGMTLLV